MKSWKLKKSRNVEAFFQDRTCIRVTLVRELFAEIIGTFLLCVIGLSAVAQFKFFAKDAKANSPGYVNFLPVNIAFGFGATVAVLVSGKVSGREIFFLKYKINYFLWN